MAERFLESLKSKLLVCDGAMGTELIGRGLEPGICPETWNADYPADVTAIHKAYVAAGANIILANTFGANRWKLEDYGLAGRVRDINAAGVAVARKAAAGRAYVLGDVGPTGRFLAPLGTEPRESFVEIYAEQAEALAKAGADGLILETFTALDEILAAVEGARRTGLPIVASMSFARTADGAFRTVMGNEARVCAVALDAAGADVIGANCGVGPDQYVGIVEAFSKATRLPVLVEPNAGMPELVKGRTIFPMSPEQFAAYVPALLDAGVRVIGGCCGTTPEHVARIKDIVASRCG